MKKKRFGRTELSISEIVLGGGWAGNIKKAGFKGELSYFINNNFNNTLSLSTSLDYSFKDGYYLSTQETSFKSARYICWRAIF